MQQEKLNISLLCVCGGFFFCRDHYYHYLVLRFSLAPFHKGALERFGSIHSKMTVQQNITKSNNNRTIELKSNVESSYRFDGNNNINNEQLPIQLVIKTILSEFD